MVEPTEAPCKGRQRKQEFPGFLILAVAFICLLVPRRFINIGQVDLIYGLIYGLSGMLFLSSSMSGTPLTSSVAGAFCGTALTLGLAGVSLVRFALGQADSAELGRTFPVLAALFVSTQISHLQLGPDRFERLLKGVFLLSAGSLGLSVVWSFSPAFFAPQGQLRILSGGALFLRATSPFGGPNLTGILGAVMAPLSFLFGGTFGVLMLFLAVFGVLLSGSKTALIAAAVSLLLYSVNGRVHRTRRLIATVLLFAAGTFVMSLLGSRALAVIDPGMGLQAGGSFRLDTWNKAIQLWLQKPFFGWGEDYHLHSSLYPFAAHNLWLELLVDHGLLVGGFLCILLLSHLIRLFTSASNLGRVGRSIAASVAALVVSSFGDYIFWEPRALAVFAILVGLLSGLKRSSYDSMHCGAHLGSNSS